MSVYQILKPRHSLQGKNLLPLVLRLRGVEGVVDLARLKRGYPLEDYSLEELATEFLGLTGEAVDDILGLAGKDRSVENLRLLVHFTILQANISGAPRGQLFGQNASGIFMLKFSGCRLGWNFSF
jgi:hypothetical protein